MSKNKTIPQLLRARYPVQSHALFFEVQSATAYKGHQRADAVAVGLWPSRGLDVIGFEFKTHRSDWLRELKSPDKAEEIFQFCDRWYLVADDNVAKVDEIPETWGWLTPVGDKLRETKAAPALSAKPLAREFVASLMRLAQKERDTAAAKPTADVEARVREEMFDQHKAELDRLRSQLEDARKERQAEIKEIENHLGVKLGRWSYPVESVGASLRLLSGRGPTLRQELVKLKSSLADILERVDAAESEMQAWPKGDEGIRGLR